MAGARLTNKKAIIAAVLAVGLSTMIFLVIQPALAVQFAMPGGQHGTEGDEDAAGRREQPGAARQAEVRGDAGGPGARRGRAGGRPRGLRPGPGRCVSSLRTGRSG